MVWYEDPSVGKGRPEGLPEDWEVRCTHDLRKLQESKSRESVRLLFRCFAKREPDEEELEHYVSTCREESLHAAAKEMSQSKEIRQYGVTVRVDSVVSARDPLGPYVAQRKRTFQPVRLRGPYLDFRSLGRSSEVEFVADLYFKILNRPPSVYDIYEKVETLQELNWRGDILATNVVASREAQKSGRMELVNVEPTTIRPMRFQSVALVEDLA